MPNEINAAHTVPDGDTDMTEAAPELGKAQQGLQIPAGPKSPDQHITLGEDVGMHGGTDSPAFGSLEGQGAASDGKKDDRAGTSGAAASAPGPQLASALAALPDILVG